MTEIRKELKIKIPTTDKEPLLTGVVVVLEGDAQWRLMMEIYEEDLVPLGGAFPHSTKAKLKAGGIGASITRLLYNRLEAMGVRCFEFDTEEERKEFERDFDANRLDPASSSGTIEADHEPE